jgi:hypothetical protein
MKESFVQILLDGIDIALYMIDGIPSVFYNECEKKKAEEVIKQIYEIEGVVL